MVPPYGEKLKPVGYEIAVNPEQPGRLKTGKNTKSQHAVVSNLSLCGLELGMQAVCSVRFNAAVVMAHNMGVRNNSDSSRVCS